MSESIYIQMLDTDLESAGRYKPISESEIAQTYMHTINNWRELASTYVQELRLLHKWNLPLRASDLQNEPSCVCDHICDLYVMPKKHKPFHTVPSTRPIIQGFRSPFYKVSVLVNCLLLPLIPQCNTVLMECSDLPEILRNTPSSGGETPITTVDVKSMYPNFPLRHLSASVQRLIESLSQDNHLMANNEQLQWLRDDLAVEFLLKLCQFYERKPTVVRACYPASREDVCLIQTEGIAMGDPASPTVANILVYVLVELKNIDMIRVECSLYLRYLDDVFIKWRYAVAEDFIFDILMQIFTGDPSVAHIQLDISSSEERLTYLDLDIKNTSPVMEFCTHFKPASLHLYIPHCSHHPKHTMAGIGRMLVCKYLRQNSTPEALDSSLQSFRRHLTACGYSDQFVDHLIAHANDEKKNLRGRSTSSL